MLDFNIGFDNFANAEQNVLFVCAMGVGTVFVGLILLIFVCKIMSLFAGNSSKQEEVSAAAPIVQQPVVEQPIENKQELIAAIS
ncbi:MAG: OadG family protein, partial [Clostridia bacterium]|nr:OadG family protein [Clostridia bacterium]